MRVGDEAAGVRAGQSVCRLSVTSALFSLSLVADERRQ